MKRNTEKKVRPTLSIRPKKIMLTRRRRLPRILNAEARAEFCKHGLLFCKNSKSDSIIQSHFFVQCVYLVLTFALCMHSALVWLQQELIKTHNFEFSTAALQENTKMCAKTVYEPCMHIMLMALYIT